MKQTERMNSASNDWEADPWDASDAVADAQLSGFQDRAAKPIVWASIRGAGPSVFGTDVTKLISANVEFYATHDDEEMLLMHLDWRGFPDPPEWKLATRLGNCVDLSWASWGYFAHLRERWRIPNG